MRIKDVAKLTELTEKTIRFYEEKQLITPNKEVINGREFRTYSEADAKNLILIANLRKLDFSISDIIKMRDNPGEIPEILEGYCSKVSNDVHSKADIIHKLEQIDYKAVKNVEDLAEQLKEVSGKRSLPAADIELEFYKFDGITKEELQMEVLGYQERTSLENRKKIRNIKILFGIFQLMFVTFSGLTLYSLDFLNYISYYHRVGWVKILIPFFLLLFIGIHFIFVKVFKYISKLNENKLYSALIICRKSLLALVVCSLFTNMAQLLFLKSMEELKVEAGRDIHQEWYEIYKMTENIDDHFSYDDYPDENLYKSLESRSIYVNPICYHFFSGDILHTKMGALLTEYYDPAFKAFDESYLDIPYEEVDKAEIADYIKELNSELLKISTEIVFPDSESFTYDDESLSKAGDYMRANNPKTIELRTRIEKLYYSSRDKWEGIIRSMKDDM